MMGRVRPERAAAHHHVLADEAIDLRMHLFVTGKDMDGTRVADAELRILGAETGGSRRI
jgi:hypothetical protein